MPSTTPFTYYDPSTGSYSYGGTALGAQETGGTSFPDTPGGGQDSWQRGDWMQQNKAGPGGKKKKKKKKTGGGGGGGSSGTRYNYGGGGSSGYSYGSSGGGGGGGGTPEWRQYGWSPEVFKGYRRFWGDTMPEELWPQYRGIADIFANYNNRLMQLADWKRIWNATQNYYTHQGINRSHGFRNIERYGPTIARLSPPAKVVLPDISYSGQLSF